MSSHCNATTFNIITFLLLLILLITATQSQSQLANPTPFPSTLPPVSTGGPTTEPPTLHPTPAPTPNPTQDPTPEPTPHPTHDPTPKPTTKPIKMPTNDPTNDPTNIATKIPTEHPTPSPTPNPTPIDNPTHSPIIIQTPNPTDFPIPNPTMVPFRTHTPTIERPTSSPIGTINPTQKPNYNPRPTEKPILMPDDQCIVGKICTKPYECCVGDPYVNPKLFGISCECEYGKDQMWSNTCDVKHCCVKIGFKGCVFDYNCCKPEAICNNGVCTMDMNGHMNSDKNGDMNGKYKAIKGKGSKMSNSLINDEASDHEISAVLDTARSNGYLEWILIGVVLFLIIMFMIFHVHQFIKDKKSNEDELGGSSRDSDDDFIAI